MIQICIKHKLRLNKLKSYIDKNPIGIEKPIPNSSYFILVLLNINLSLSSGSMGKLRLLNSTCFNHEYKLILSNSNGIIFCATQYDFLLTFEKNQFLFTSLIIANHKLHEQFPKGRQWK